MTRERKLERIVARQWRRSAERDARLARLLHDGAAQQATALKLALSSLRRQIPEAAANQLQDVESLATDLVASLAALAGEVSASGADKLGLDAAVRWHAGRLERTTDAAVVTCLAEPAQVSPGIAAAVLAVLEEALENVARHAGPSKVEVRLDTRGEEVVLTVSDNGRGFLPRLDSSQAGLAEMRERIRAAGGTLELLSKPGHGTRITAVFPADPELGSVSLSGSGQRVIHVLMADDHPIVRRGLKQILSEQPGMAVDEVGSFPALREYLTRRIPDVLVLDINMPGGNGIEMVGEINRHYSQLPVLVLSVHPEEQAGVRAILAGARGYVPKDAAPEKLAEAVKRLFARGRYISPRLSDALAEYVQTPRSSLRPHELLSSRELTVLLLIAAGNSTSQIATHLNISPKTVGTYRARLFEKLGMKSAADLTRYVMENRLAEAAPALEGSP